MRQPGDALLVDAKELPRLVEDGTVICTFCMSTTYIALRKRSRLP